MNDFQPPRFLPHPFLRGGHLQTIVAPRTKKIRLNANQIVVPVSDGDSIVLHEDQPAAPLTSSMLLIHGISGCHAAPYMLRIAKRFTRLGVCVYRMDMRGCGAGAKLTSNLTHAGRSDDVLAALQTIANQNEGPIQAIGVSLGANQLLRAVGRIGAGVDETPSWFDRLTKMAVVAPPLDLQRCSDNMERWILRPYNRYFISALLKRAPLGVVQRADFQRQLALGRPRTLKELDERITGPLSGFEGATDYYATSSAGLVAGSNPVRTLVLAAEDDPIVPIGCFVDDKGMWSEATELLVTKTGGHVGFINSHRESWMDEVLAAWFEMDS
ncbi:MAG: YheT family hydrolase [Rubripirellula sp.]